MYITDSFGFEHFPSPRVYLDEQFPTFATMVHVPQGVRVEPAGVRENNINNNFMFQM